MNSLRLGLLILLLTRLLQFECTAEPANLSLRETIVRSALHDVQNGPVLITGLSSNSFVHIRVTTTRGTSHTNRVACTEGRFKCRYPQDFAGAPPLEPGMLLIDASPNSDFDAKQQAEIAVIIFRGLKDPPALPFGFTSDLRDSQGRCDQASAQWTAARTLANLYMRSRAARIVRVGRPSFDLAAPEDLVWFKNHLTLYEFDYRDRDWSQPLSHRVARTFWQSVWNTWFNSSNDHPLDGNPANRHSTNYLPYAFANDYADVLIMEWMRHLPDPEARRHQTNACREAALNLLAMQHRAETNFALPDATGKRELYTGGAFRYGMFENGEFMTEGKGWFYNPKFRDYEQGGVLNARALWGLGETLRHDPNGPLADSVRSALALGLKFCLQDGAARGYVKRTAQGNVYWRDPGEHAYLTLGLLAACTAVPDMKLPLREPCTLKEACFQSLNALADLERPTHQWEMYPNSDSMAVAALAQGALQFSQHPAAARWRSTAVRVTDAWLSAAVDPKEIAGEPVHFGLRNKPGRMTYIWPGADHPRFFYYQTGHWIHALADLYQLTGTERYRQRAEAMVSNLCGNNPWEVRLFNELGAVYNWTDDANHDGHADQLRQDMYPESTAFCQIGIMRLWQALAHRAKPRP